MDGTMKVSEFSLACIILLLGSGIVLRVNTFPVVGGMAYGPAFFPRLVGIGFIVCSVLLFGSAWLKRRAVVENASERTTLVAGANLPSVFRFLSILVALGLYIAGGPVLGFLATTTLVTGAMFAMFRVKLRLLLILSPCLSVSLYLLFEQLLRVPLPRGLLERLIF